MRDVEGVRHLAELGVVFLLFNIGLELSLERLRSMQKFVFGLGSAQVRPWRPAPEPVHHVQACSKESMHLVSEIHAFSVLGLWRTLA